MRVLDPGHSYSLRNLEGGGETVLRFHKDPELHNGEGYPGPTCQEVIRAIIDRVQSLDFERPWEGNATIIHDLRHALAGFEARAIIRRVEKDGLEIERLALAEDGHLKLAALAIDAGTGATAGRDPKGESAGPKDNAQEGVSHGQGNQG